MAIEYRNFLLSALSPGDMDALAPGLKPIAFRRGDVLCDYGDVPDKVIFPTTAVLSIVTVMSDGAAVESSTIGHESATPLLWALSGESNKGRVFVQVGGEAYILSAIRLRSRAAQSPDLMALLLRHIASISFQAEQGVACNILHSARARLARWILMTQDRVGQRALPLSQEYMATMLGVQRTTITLVAGQLRDAGLIKFARGVLEVTDRDGLEGVACECYKEVRQEFEALRQAGGRVRPVRAVQ
jgi:CRP-like cAMP-binding protein